MNTFSHYADLYGYNGWRSDIPNISALLMMVRDEIAQPGLTALSQFDRSFLLELDTTSAYTLQVSMVSDVYKLYFAIPASAPPDSTNYDGLSPTESNAAFEPYVKQYAEIKFMHGGMNDPFTHYTDTITNSGTLVRDYGGTIDLNLIRDAYGAALSSKALGISITERSSIVTSNEIFATMLARAIENGIATASQVQEDFGTYAPTVVATAMAMHDGENSNVTLQPLPALADPMSTFAFKAYLAYFGRPPDTGGLTSWVNHLHNPNYTMQNLIEVFGNSDESNTLYSNASATSRVEAIYQYLFNRLPEQEGRAFWVGAIERGELSMAGAAFHILGGARDDASQGTYDLTVVNAKIDGARTFVAALDTQREVDLYVGQTAALNGRKYLSTITADTEHNTQVVQLVGQVINLLPASVDDLFSQHGIALGHY